MLAANHLDADVAAATEEVAADYAGRLMSDGDTMEQFIQQNQHRPSLLKRMAEAFRELWRKLTGRERTQAEEAAYRLEKAYEKAVKEAKKGGKVDGAKSDWKSVNQYANRSLTNDAEIYSYSFLTSLPDMHTTTLPDVETIQGEAGRVFPAAAVKDGMKNARSVGTERGGKVYVKNAYTGRELRIDVSSIRHGLSGNGNRILTNARLGAVIGNVVQNAVPINALKNKAEGVTGTYVMAAYAVDNAGREIVAIVTVEQRSGTVSEIEAYDVTHAVSGRQKRRAQVDTKSQGVYPSMHASKIKIADFLEVVKSTHQSILSDDVLNELGIERNPSGFYTNQVRFSLRQPAEGQNVNNNLSKKERQFQTIQQSNPAADAYHTWIRSADEIRTFEEVLADPEWDYSEFDPDYTRAMAEEALRSGEITVYSSYPISEGVFVSPSRMEAESYSGSGKVYSKTVSLDDVAWIDPTQGQYAPIDEQTDTSSRQSLRTDAELEAAVREIQQKREAGEITAEEAREQIIQKGEEAYQRMIEQYGEIQQGEKPARQISVPKQTSKDTKVTQTIRTVLEARVTPDMAVPDIKTMVANGTFSYEVIGDKATLSEAKGKIANDGWANAYSAWMQDMKKGVYTKFNTALGAELYNNAVNHGDIQAAMDILMELAASQRAAGQVVQATKIIKQLSPEAQLFGVARSVKSIQEELNRRYGDENAPTLIISEELAEQYMKADTEQARENALNDIYQNIGEQIPPTFTDKWNAWRYLAMLGNPRTQIRNVFGNLFFAPVVMAKNTVGMTIIEPVGRLLSGDKSGRSKAFYTRELYRAALGDYANVESEIMNGTKYSDSAMQNSAIREGPRVFRFKPLEAYRKLTGLKEAAERLHRQPSAEGNSVKGRRTMARLFIPDLVFPEHIEMGENIFLYFGDMTECHVLYWLRQF